MTNPDTTTPPRAVHIEYDVPVIVAKFIIACIGFGAAQTLSQKDISYRQIMDIKEDMVAADAVLIGDMITFIRSQNSI